MNAPHEEIIASIPAEQAVLGALLGDNDALDRIGDLEAEHFYRHDHRIIFTETIRQIREGHRADALTVAEKVGDKVEDCLPYLAELLHSAPSAANIGYHAAIVTDKAVKRALVALSYEIRDLTSTPQSASSCVDFSAAKLDALSQRRSVGEPRHIALMLGDYADLLQARMDGSIKPIRTGFGDLDNLLDGGFERGTLTVVAARPGMGKTAAGLGVARNVGEWGTSLFFSMEMAPAQINDRNAAALGSVPLQWLRKPTETNSGDTDYWTAVFHAFKRVQELNLFIDDKAGLNMLEIRAKARQVKRKAGLDLIVVDQLSFITGGKSDKAYEVVGEYTRALVALAKELDCAVILLCQLNRECERRTDKRPIMADLAMSGSIEQDAANIIFLYRDEVYSPDTTERGVCEWNLIKARQGRPGTIALAYEDRFVRFADLGRHWSPPNRKAASRPPPKRGFDE